METTSSFESILARVLREIRDTKGGAQVRPGEDLRDYLETLYREACRRPIHATSLREALRAVLQYLAVAPGNTHDNLWVTSNFVMPGNDYWAESWLDLPEPFCKVLHKMGTAMWQSQADQEWTREFRGLPTQLLAMLEAPINGAG